MLRAPFAPLAADAAGLDAFPAPPRALVARMAEIYGVDPACILAVQGVAAALNLVLRRAAFDGRCTVAGPESAALLRLALINRLHIAAAPDADVTIVASPAPTSPGAPPVAAVAPDKLVVVDESLIEFERAASLCARASTTPNLIVLRSLDYAYGLAGAPCAAIIAAPDQIARLNDIADPDPLAAPIARLAESVLSPSRVLANTGRIEEVLAERRRLAAALPNASEGGGPFVVVRPGDAEAARRDVTRFGVPGMWLGDAFLLSVSSPDVNARALAAFGVQPGAPRRRGEVVRETKETQIVARVDLDGAAPSVIATGVGFFDHMLSQVALHGGFALTLTCDGDLEVDGHHTIEDCALAMGAALKEALGTRRGIARFGFVLPMDEAEAQVSIDLSGRPHAVFDGAFAAGAIGAYPTEMTAHVFRSLAQSMGAAIHVSVRGENDHHKTEACFKAFGRALRQAVRIEGDALPSTKGAL